LHCVDGGCGGLLTILQSRYELMHCLLFCMGVSHASIETPTQYVTTEHVCMT
jgi:hypothetical protein